MLSRLLALILAAAPALSQGLSELRSDYRHSKDAQERLELVEVEAGLPGRPWYRNRLWTAGLETGYASETFPTLRAAAAENEEALERELASLIEALRGLPRREDAPAAAR